MVDMFGVWPFCRMYWIAEVPTYMTKALINCNGMNVEHSTHFQLFQ